MERAHRIYNQHSCGNACCKAHTRSLVRRVYFASTRRASPPQSTSKFRMPMHTPRCYWHCNSARKRYCRLSPPPSRHSPGLRCSCRFFSPFRQPLLQSCLQLCAWCALARRAHLVARLDGVAVRRVTPGRVPLTASYYCHATRCICRRLGRERLVHAAESPVARASPKQPEIRYVDSLPTSNFSYKCAAAKCTSVVTSSSPRSALKKLRKCAARTLLSQWPTTPCSSKASYRC